MDAPAHPVGLLLLALGVVVGLVVLIARFHWNPFVALLCASLGLGVASGTNLAAVTRAVGEGMGAVLGSVAAIIGLGTILGRLLAESGAAEVVAQAFLSRSGVRRTPWVMAGIGVLVGLAVWFSVGLVLLVPVVVSVARRCGVSLLVPGLPMLAGLSVMHGLVPPHPGPMIALGLLHADTGRTLLYALMVGLPTVMVAGPCLVRWVDGKVQAAVAGLPESSPLPSTAGSRPGLILTVFVLLLPVLLIAGATLVDVALEMLFRGQEWASNQGHVWFFRVRGGLERVRPAMAFLGSPLVAMLSAVLFSTFTLGVARGVERRQLARWAEESLAPVASILLVVGAGGAFSKVLDACGVGRAMATAAEGWALSPLVMGWLVAALLRVAVGSATVAISTAAAVVAPLTALAPGTPPELVVLAMGAGSLILSHVNDGGFWLVKEYFGLSIGDTLKTWTVMETVISVTAFALLWVLDRFV